MAVAEELHFARAAARLGMEQSPLSHSIQNLEERLGVKLLHRTTRRTLLTRAGIRLLKDAKRILSDVEATAEALRSGAIDGAAVRLGLAEHAAGEPFTRLLFELEHHRPAISVELSEILPADAIRLVAGGELDIAIALETVVAPGLRCRRAWAENVALLLPLGHDFAQRIAISFSEITTEKFILPHPISSPGCALQLETLFDRYSVRPARRVLVEHQNAMASLVAAGKGWLSCQPRSHLA